MANYSGGRHDHSKAFKPKYGMGHGNMDSRTNYSEWYNPEGRFQFRIEVSEASEIKVQYRRKPTGRGRYPKITQKKGFSSVVNNKRVVKVKNNKGELVFIWNYLKELKV